MKKNTKWYTISAWVLCLCFTLALWGGAVAYLLCPDKAASTAERRQLTKWPAFSQKAWQDGTYASRLELYAKDHFPLREQVRQVKALTQYYGLLRMDNNGYYRAEGHLAKLEYPLKPREIQRGADKFIELAQKYFAGCSLYYALVPDKNYYLAEKSGRPALDYGQIEKILDEALAGEGFCKIEIAEYLSLDDYYPTDTHWQQEKIVPVARALARAMGVEERCSWEYTEKDAGAFYGVFYGQAALPMAADRLTTLHNETIDKAVVYDLQGKALGGVYAMEKLTDGTSMDGYDIYLYGATPYVEITNPAGEGQLILLRDSFGSSIAPLLTEGYGRITVIDLRYIATDVLAEVLTVEPGADVLYLYSPLSLNNASMFK